jgi:hypothetical protein
VAASLRRVASYHTSDGLGRSAHQTARHKAMTRSSWEPDAAS